MNENLYYYRKRKIKNNILFLYHLHSLSLSFFFHLHIHFRHMLSELAYRLQEVVPFTESETLLPSWASIANYQYNIYVYVCIYTSTIDSICDLKNSSFEF